MNRSTEISRLLRAHAAGDPDALDSLFPLVYDELRRLSRAQLARTPAGPRSLDSTALVHELYLKLNHREGGAWDDRRHFMAVAAKAMRHIIVDHARHAAAIKRDGGLRVTLSGWGKQVGDPTEILALDAALARLEKLSARSGLVVQLRFFAGLSVHETAFVLGVDASTVKRDWVRSRAFLRRELSGGAGRESPP